MKNGSLFMKAQTECDICKSRCTMRSGNSLGQLEWNVMYAMSGVRRNVWTVTYARPFAQQSPGIGLECEEWKVDCVGSNRM